MNTVFFSLINGQRKKSLPYVLLSLGVLYNDTQKKNFTMYIDDFFCDYISLRYIRIDVPFGRFDSFPMHLLNACRRRRAAACLAN